MEYFIELFRVSKHQIIFGANYFIKYIPEGGSWIVWDKVRTDGIRSGFELAWTSIKKANSIARFMWDGFKTCCKRIGNHPHEKPIKLYAWLLTNYAKPDWKILDTHLGSGTSAIACIDAGLNLMACEIDETYYKQAKEVIRKHEQQQQLFTAKETTVFYSLFGEYLGGIDAKAHHK
jgi:site-specific DNA-methyltransferase (adenine-specific)